jgi:hypothetical protein
MPTPNWLAAVTGQTAFASQVNQFLGTHDIQYGYGGAAFDANGGTATGTLNTNTGSAAQWVAQSFTTAASGVGSTASSRIEFHLSLAGTGADMSVEVRDDNAGVPANTAPRLSYTFPLDFLTSTDTQFSLPIPQTGLTASTKYWVVFDGTSNTTNFNKIGRFAAVASKHAFTSSTGTGSWVDSTFTAMYVAFANGTPTVNANASALVNTFEDNGARWTMYALNGSMGYAGSPSGSIAKVYEYTTGSLRSVRTLGYTGGILTSVT